MGANLGFRNVRAEEFAKRMRAWKIQKRERKRERNFFVLVSCWFKRERERERERGACTGCSRFVWETEREAVRNSRADKARWGEEELG